MQDSVAVGSPRCNRVYPNLRQAGDLADRNIPLFIGTWRGSMGPKNLPAEVVSTFKAAVATMAREPGAAGHLEAAGPRLRVHRHVGFKSVMARDNPVFKDLFGKLGDRPRFR